MTPLRIHKTNQGFTLIEILVVLVLSLVVLGAVLNIFIMQNQTSTAQQEITYAQQNVRAAMDLMMREIRNAGYDPTGTVFNTGNLPIAQATGTLIQVRSDYRGANPDDPPNGAIEPSEDVTYSLNAQSQLERNGNLLVNSPGGLSFGYVLADGTVYDPPAPGDPPVDLSNIGTPPQDRRDEIRAVIIFIAVATEHEAPDTGEYRLRSLMNATSIRNLRFQDID